MEIGLREEIREERVRMYEHLRHCMEIVCNGNFLKYMEVIQMKSPNNEEDRVPTVHLLSPNQVSIIGRDLH